MNIKKSHNKILILIFILSLIFSNLSFSFSDLDVEFCQDYYVSGTKYHDLNGNGERDRDEPGLEGFKIYIDEDDDGIWDEGEPFDITDEDGHYQIPTYRNPCYCEFFILREVPQRGWFQSEPIRPNYYELNYFDFHLNYNFGNFQYASADGYKFFDLNTDGYWDENEIALEDFTIYVDYNDNETLDEGEPFDVTDSDGYYSISDIHPGTYNLLEVQKCCWVQTTPNKPSSYPIDFVSATYEGPFNFGNWGSMSKPGYKFNDLDGDGRWDEEEPGLEGFTIYVDYNDNGTLDRGEPFDVTDGEGFYLITDIQPGTYKVREVQEEGWTQSYPVDPTYYNEIFDPCTQFCDGNFGNWEEITKSGTKFYDINGNGTWDEEEPGLPDFTIYVDYNDNDLLDRGEPFGISDEEGNYTITGIHPGTFKVREVQQEGWIQTYPRCGCYEEKFISGAVLEENNFGNKSNSGGLTIYKDVTNVTDDPTDFTFEIYQLGDSGRILIKTLTASELEEAFTRLPAGTYYIYEVPMSDYSTVLATQEVEIETGEITDVTFENTLEVGGLRVYKDVTNVTDDPTEFTFEIYQLGDSGRILIKTLTASELEEAFTRLPAGTYYIYEVPMSDYSTVLATQEVEIDTGEVTDVIFENTKNEIVDFWYLHGYVFYDEDEDNIKDEGEVGYEGIAIYLDDNPEHSTTTDEYGYYYFDQIPGTSGDVVVTVESTVSADAEVSEYDGTLDESVEVAFGDEYDEPLINFGYKDYDEPQYGLSINKTVNDSSITLGQTVTFTITVTNTGDLSLYNVEVDDNRHGELGTIALLDPEETETFTYTYKPTSTGVYVNTATAVAIEQIGPVSDDASVTVSRETTTTTTSTNYTVSGYVFMDENANNAVDTGDVGYEGITVDLYQGSLKIRTTTTDTTGRYTFTSLRGTYTIVVDSGNDIPDIEISEYDDVLDQEVELSVYENKTNINFGYSSAPLAAPIAVSGYIFNDINANKIVDSGEMGYEGITVELRNLSDDILASTTTNANGLYVLSAYVGPGQYMVVNDPLGDIPLLYDVISQVSEYDNVLDEVINIFAIEDGDNIFLGRNFGYEETPKAVATVLSGYVFNDGNSNNLVDTGETGYSGVEMTIWKDALPILTKTTNVSGMYVFDFLTDPELNGLEAGEYTITIGDPPVNVHAVSEYDGSPFNGIVVLTLTDTTEAIANINFGFGDTVVPSGEESNVSLMFLGLFLIVSGISIRRKA
ncbi:MAG: DUF11 domain-containing protein [Clostridiales bacterium]|nr:DUF11 domain-containing protein [Clostridiales bacterium]